MTTTQTILSYIDLLNAREQKLIELNRKNDYTFQVHTVNGKRMQKHPKLQKYLDLLLEIKRRKVALWKRRREIDARYGANVDKAWKSLVNNADWHSILTTNF